jgi:hypothetical protein
LLARLAPLQVPRWLGHVVGGAEATGKVDDFATTGTTDDEPITYTYKPAGARDRQTPQMITFFDVKPDLDHFQYFLLDERAAEERERLVFDGKPMRNTWRRPPVYSYQPRLEEGDFWASCSKQHSPSDPRLGGTKDLTCSSSELVSCCRWTTMEGSFES